MAKVNADEFVDKYVRRMKGSLEDIRAGVEKVDEAPTKRAAEKIEKMKQNWLKALEEGKIEEGLKSVGLDEWKEAMKTDGVNRIPSGVERARPKLRDFAEKLLRHIEEGQRVLKDMPDLTLEDNIARMEKWIRHMAKFRK